MSFWKPLWPVLGSIRDPITFKSVPTLGPKCKQQKFIRSQAEDRPPTGWKRSWEAGFPPGPGFGGREGVGIVYK